MPFAEGQTSVECPTVLEFEFTPRTRIVFGVKSVDRVGQLVRQCGGTRVLLVSDVGVARAGHVARAEGSLRAAGVSVAVFDRVVENPTTRVVDLCVAVGRQEKVDFLVGLGGGSSMDTAKGANFILTNGGRMADYWGVGKAAQPMLPMIAIPTTAGTGSECQSFALIAQEETHVKMACGDPKAAAKVAILDPELTLTQPMVVALTTGMDALSHAVESAVTTRRNGISQMLSREAFRLCSRGLRGVLADPQDVQARGEALLGAALGGMAIENSMLGAAHAAANPLTARLGIVHGQAVGLMLPAVVRFNAQQAAAGDIYQQLALQAGLTHGDRGPAAATEALIEFLEDYRRQAGLPESLAAVNVEEADLDGLAQEAAAQWTAGFNPRPVNSADFADLYRSVWRDRQLSEARV